jgi:late competence protein required for DNA uptake (superfamily II DNA/RNA helicase)
MMVTSIRATKIQPAAGGGKAPCRRCGREISIVAGRTSYCASCITVLRHDPDYFQNLAPDEADQLRNRVTYKRHDPEPAS